MKTTFLAFFVCMLAFFGTLIYALPDAQIVSAITYAPTTIVSGDTVTFTANFRIVDEAVTNFKVEGGVDGAVIYTRTYSSIAAGATRTMSFTWTATAGTHVVYFKLDPSNNIGESDENNNLKELSLEISGVQHQTELNFNVGPEITPWDQLFTGTSLNIKAQVYNHNTVVNNVKIKVTIDGIQVWQTTVAQMTANSYYWVDFNWVATIGSHTLNVIIDPDNTIAESNETNNEWSLPFTVTDAPQAPDPSQLTDLKFNGNITFSPFNPQEGDSQTVKVNVYLASSLTVNNIKIEGGINGVKLHEEIISTMTGYSTKQIQFTWTTTVGTPVAYFKIDPENTIGENNEGNNTLNATTNVSAKPVGPTPGQPCDPQWRDQGIAGVGPGVQKPQQNIRLRNVIKNTGNTAVNLKVTAGVGDKKLKEEIFQTFAVVEESNFFFDWKPMTGGKYTVWLQIDPNNEQNDTNRNNNRVEKQIEVSELQLSTSPAGLEAKFNQEQDPCESNSSVTPDLKLVSFTQKAPYEKEKAYFSIGIKNESDRCIKGLGIGIYSDTISVGGPALKFWVNSEGKISTSPYSLGGASGNKWFLKAKETKTISYYILSSNVNGKTDCVIAAAGNASGVCQELKAKVDFEDNITESDENNNASPFKVFSWKK